MALLLAAGSISTAQAEAAGARITPLPAYQQECAACHTAYPPGLLPAALHGSIRVNVAFESGQPVLRVEDSGPGMTAPEMSRLGERFYRVLGHEQPGSGLGWSIVKRIGDVLGAQVQVRRSDALGGLAVSVHWPLPGPGPG